LPSPGLEDYLGLGLADALIARLSNIRQIAVRPTSAVRQYAGGTRDFRVAGRELDVDAVLEGNIQRAGERIRVTVQLVNVRTGVSLWAQRFDQSFSDILSVEDSISERVAESLLVTLTGEERRRLARRYTDNSKAYAEYLRGRYHWNKRTEAGLRKAIECFGQAIEHDPSYVVAYAGLADSYVLLSHYSIVAPREVMPRAEAAAAKASELDEELAEPHVTLGWVHFAFHWDWPAAEREFSRAIALNPGYATAHQWLAMYLMAMRRHDESMDRITEALRLDPLSLPINQCRAFMLYLGRRYAEALKQYAQTVDLDPNFAVAHILFGWAYVQTAQWPPAIEQFEKALSLTERSTLALAGLGYGYAASGQTAAAHDVLRQLREKLDRQHVSAYHVAPIALALGDTNQAYEWLERAYRDRSDWLVYLDVDPWLDALRTEPRFRDLRQRVGLP
jgi:TolB-like protein/lipoprotein NlpI